ncbi:MAG: AbrB/MazE/SpoVT family DNA-binding domain-containing protein [Dehalococcoidia bacterium]
MRQYLSSVSQKGQITIPTEVRRMLHIQPRDKVAIEIEGDVLTVRPIFTDLEASFMAIPALPRQYTDNEMTEIAAEEHALEAAKAGL